MDDEIAVIDQDPAPFLGPFQTQLGLAQLLHGLVDVAGDRVALPA